MKKSRVYGVVIIVAIVMTFFLLYFFSISNKENIQIEDVMLTSVEVSKVNLSAISKERYLSGLCKDMLGTVDLELVKSDLDKFKVGNEVDVEVHLTDGIHETKASVVAITDIPDQRTGQYIVSLKVNGLESNIFPGSFIKAKVNYNNKENIIVIDKNSIIRDLDKSYVYTLEDNKVHLTEITTGIESDNNIEVTSGLNEGDTIVIKGMNFIKDKMTVNVVGGNS